jgi:hypothetical protein
LRGPSGMRVALAAPLALALGALLTLDLRSAEARDTRRAEVMRITLDTTRHCRARVTHAPISPSHRRQVIDIRIDCAPAAARASAKTRARSARLHARATGPRRCFVLGNQSFCE